MNRPSLISILSLFVFTLLTVASKPIQPEQKTVTDIPIIASPEMVVNPFRSSAPDDMFAWTSIVFQSSQAGNPEIYYMKANETQPNRLTYNSAYDGNPNLSTDASKVVFESTATEIMKSIR